MRGIKLPHAKHTVVALISTLVLSTLAVTGGTALALLGEGHLSPQQSVAAVVAFPQPVTNTPTLVGTAAIIFDPTNGRILYAKNADAQLPLASITKLMTAEIVLSSESPETPVTITQSALAPEAGSGLKVGDVIPLNQLLQLGLIASSNDAMEAAAESLGPDYLVHMNQTAQNLGLAKTYFLNPTGLDVNADTSGAYSSAYDVARLAATFYKQYPTFFVQTQRKSVSIEIGNRTLTKEATDAPLLSIPGLVGAKTGYTDLAGGNLVAIFDVEIGHPLVAVILGSTRDGRFTDIKTLIATARKN